MVHFDRFEKWYGKRCAVKTLDLKIPRGEAFAFLGPNGSGKTTILRALVGLHSPTRGRILIDGTDIKRDSLRARKMTAYLPQRVTVPELLTAREVLHLHAGLKSRPRRRVAEVLEIMALQDDADRFLREFSGGMLQRLGLAIAFLVDAELLVLDEPTLNLDALGIERFRELIRAARRRGSTIVISSHIVQDAEQLVDQVGILVAGHLVKVEPVADFREHISRETRVRVVLNGSKNGVLQAASSAGAERIHYQGRSFSFKAAPECRLNIIRAIEEAGGRITEFHTDPPNWEALMGEQFKTKGGGIDAD